MKKNSKEMKFQTGLSEIPPFLGVNGFHFTLQVKKEGLRFGRIEIYDGSIKWIPPKSKKAYYTKTWEQFKDFMEG